MKTGKATRFCALSSLNQIMLAIKVGRHYIQRKETQFLEFPIRGDP
jgi:hypothetical protein